MRRPFHPEATLHDVNSELSIFGTYLGKGEFDVKIRGSNRSKHETIFNRTEGYLVRSKVNKQFYNNEIQSALNIDSFI
jgi:hypothetical protein